MAKAKVKVYALPTSREDALPEVGAFGFDDFYRARYFSQVIEKYTTQAQAEALVKFARERRVSGMSFADTLEATARFLHSGVDGAVERMMAMTKKSPQHTEREVAFNLACRAAMATYGTKGDDVFKAMLEGLCTIYPHATRERILGAMNLGNTDEGFSVGNVIEAMELGEVPT